MERIKFLEATIVKIVNQQTAQYSALQDIIMIISYLLKKGDCSDEEIQEYKKSFIDKNKEFIKTKTI
jgi:hypothetical protein